MKILSGSIMLMLVAAVAFAQSESGGEPSFSVLDTNADGHISPVEAEADPRVAAGFQKADTDRDGYLSLKEFVAMWS